MTRQVIFVGSTSFSGSTMMDLILANDPHGFSMGEVSFLYHPEQPHHLTPRCACADPTCRIWQNLRGVPQERLYAAFFEQHPDIRFIVDSSKDPLWIAKQRAALSRQGIGSKVLLVWKTPHEIATSFNQRGTFDRWTRHWLNYHRLFLTEIGTDFVGMSYRDFAQSPERLADVCAKLGIAYFPGKEAYWDKVHHTLFGNRSARRHLNSVEARLQNASYVDNHQLKSIYYKPPSDPDVIARVDAQLTTDPLLRATAELLEQVAAGTPTERLDLPQVRMPAHQVMARRIRRSLPRADVLRARMRVAIHRPPVPRRMPNATHRIAFAIPGHISAVVGGAENQAEIIIETLSDRLGKDGYISYHCRKANPGYATPTHETWIVPRIPLLWRFAYFWDLPFLVRDMAGLKPQVIYQRDAGAYTAAVVRAARKSGSRTVLHIAHDKDVTPLARPYPRNLLKRIDKALLERALPHIDYIIAQTPEQDRLLRQYYGRGADMVLPNVQRVPEPDWTKDARPLVLWVANSTDSKRPTLFVELAQALADTSARFVMVGTTRPSDADMLAQIAAMPNIEHLGPRTQQEVFDLMGRASLFVNTSDREGFPNVFIQAWMRETPVFSVAVNPESALDDEQIGQVTGVEGLALAVRAALSDPGRRAAMGAEARRRAVARYGPATLQPLVEMLTA